MNQDIKVEIGKKIRNARVNRGLTQADICDDESDLTIRQLARIENGQAMATIPKLMYLSQKLGVSIQDLVAIEKIEVPKEYLILKNKIIKFHTYGDEQRIIEQEKMFDEVYEKFYDVLPEEEQLLVEVLQIHASVFNNNDIRFGLALLEEYFQQILKKKNYSYNDLLIINVYFLCCSLGLEDKQYFDELTNRVLLCIDYSDSEHLYILERILVSILDQVNVEDYLTYTKVLREIIHETNSYQHKPVVYVCEAKYYLQIKKDKEKMIETYDKAITLAKIFNDDVLIKKLEIEKNNDLSAT